MSLKNVLVVGVVAILGSWLAGCGANVKPGAANVKPAGKETTAEHTHDGWWCDEHGVPEGICTQCDAKLTADYKAKGDWCAKHQRADSQCFVCHPEKEAEFAADYEARYGKKPPKAVN